LDKKKNSLKELGHHGQKDRGPSQRSSKKKEIKKQSTEPDGGHRSGKKDFPGTIPGTERLGKVTKQNRSRREKKKSLLAQKQETDTRTQGENPAKKNAAQIKKTVRGKN